MAFRRSALVRRNIWSWRFARVLCALTLVVATLAPLPLMQTVSSAVNVLISLAVPCLQEKTETQAQGDAKRIVSRESAPQHTRVPRIRITIREIRDVPFAIAVTSVMIVSPEIVTAQIKNPSSLTLTGLKVGETILILYEGQRRSTFLIEVVGRTFATISRVKTLEEQSAIESNGISGSIALSFSAPIGDSPTLLRQSFQLRQTLSPGHTLRFSGEMYKFMGQGNRDLVRATTPGFGLDRVSLGLDTPNGTFDILDSQINISPLSFNNFTMRGFHLISTPDSKLRGMEFFAGLARPSLSLLDASHGQLVGVVLPVAQGQTWRVRAGMLMVAPQRTNDVGTGGTVWQLDGRYASGSNVLAEGEAAYANGGLSWRARLDLRHGPISFFSEVLRFDRHSPLISIGVQPGGRRSEAFAFQWRKGSRFNVALSYNHTSILPPPNAGRVTFDRATIAASATYKISQNSRFGLRYTEQRLEVGMQQGGSRFHLETRTAAINHNIRFNGSWSNNLDTRLNISREARADAGTEKGLFFSDHLRYSWRGGSATGFVNYTRRTPSLAGLIIKIPSLLPPLLQQAFLADPAHFLQENRDLLAQLLPGIDLPETRNLEAGLRLQAAFSRLSLAGELRYSAGEILARDQRSLFASLNAIIKLDSANSVQVSGGRSFAFGSGGGQSSLTVSYIHRFGAGSGGGFQFSKLLGLDHGQIQGRVFFDLNGNGHDDANEPGIPGMTIQVDGGLNATTDANGRFHYASINPGKYNIALISADLGIRLRANTSTEQRVLLSSKQIINVSFGVSNYGTVSGRVFNDLLLAGGMPEASMPGLSGMRIILHQMDAGVDTITGTTDASGSYEFRNVRPGNYTLEIDPATLPANFRLPSQSSWPVMVGPLQSFYLDIPLAAQRAVSGIAFVDTNGDGRFDPQHDEVVEGARVAAGPVETISSNGGSYILRNLPAGIIKIIARAPGSIKYGSITVELGAEPTMRRNFNLSVTR